MEEVERGALEVLVRPEGMTPFLATCALGFRDPIVPTGVWSTPDPHEVCAVSGGYAYLIDTADPSRFTMLSYRPVLQVHPAVEKKSHPGRSDRGGVASRVGSDEPGLVRTI